MAELTQPFPPGDYPVVVIGSGPGALQTSYFLSQRGVAHAVISEDPAPGGMFRRFPLFQRLITWSKRYAPVPRGTREYEWYDWDSLLGNEASLRALVPEGMDGTSYFPSRPEMERGLVEFVNRAGVQVRYNCTWESTQKTDDGFVVGTTDGDYHAKAIVVAVGTTQPWKPTNIPGIELVPHYVETKPAHEYQNKRVFIMGKRNSGFEIADALLPWASQMILGSPRPAKISVLTHSTASARARYLQPYEDAALGGGHVVLDAAIERVERTGEGFRVFAKGTTLPGDYVLDVDEVIAATGFTTPMRDLKELGVATFYQNRLPGQTPYWESSSVPGIYFAGSITQGAVGLKKYGIPSNSAAVHGFRYNARVLAGHIASARFGMAPERTPIKSGDVIDYLLAEATHAPELWNQQSYLTRVITFDETGIVDDGIQPLSHFVDASGADAIAMAIETDEAGDIHPCVYVRRGGKVDEHILASNALHQFETSEHHSQLAGLLKGLLE